MRTRAARAPNGRPIIGSRLTRAIIQSRAPSDPDCSSANNPAPSAATTAALNEHESRAGRPARLPSAGAKLPLPPLVPAAKKSFFTQVAGSRPRCSRSRALIDPRPRGRARDFRPPMPPPFRSPGRLELARCSWRWRRQRQRQRQRLEWRWAKTTRRLFGCRQICHAPPLFPSPLLHHLRSPERGPVRTLSRAPAPPEASWPLAWRRRRGCASALRFASTSMSLGSQINTLGPAPLSARWQPARAAICAQGASPASKSSTTPLGRRPAARQACRNERRPIWQWRRARAA